MPSLLYRRRFFNANESLKMLKVGFIGAGTVGTALSVRLNGKGYPIVAVSSKESTHAENLAKAISGCQVYKTNQDVVNNAELIFVTTPDDVIASVVAQLNWQPGQSVVHCSGAASTDILKPASTSGASTGAFHPLQTFASIKQAIENIPGSTFAIEAEEPLLSTLKEMATNLDGQWVVLKASDKVLYHASAVIACNYLVTLVKLATDLWQNFDIPTPQATQALLPLIKGTLNNIEIVGIPGCLTGPIARGDKGTIQKHLDALSQTAPSLLTTYRELGLQTVPIALAKGRIDENKAQELRDILQPVK